ncbi:carboxymuconolactone decarboxylase family protein [Nocardioides daejeonensis]|uniref:carboxymuconolactone decarboxylase family protein n=1 Tax=Nocardioides daejeonensis TaxID=1046556 RepID=UPI000D744C21|nr:carboxymuconolactone decarboxylase family protein [Nocardioides daejeonensis]
MTSAEPRIAPGRLRQVGPFVWAFSRAAGRVARSEPPGVFLTLGRNRRLFWGWLHFAGRLMPGGRLPRRETELVILRVAASAGSEYEWTQHAGMGARAGLSQAELAALRDLTGEAEYPWPERDAMLLRVTDELLTEQDLSDDTWALMSGHLDERRCIELVMLVGHYRMLATALQTFRVRPDRPRSR